MFDQSFEVFSSLTVFYVIQYQEAAFLTALVYGLLGKTTDTATLTLSTAPVPGSSPCSVCIINDIEFDTISSSKVQELISFLRLRGRNASACKKELIARVFIARASCKIRRGSPPRDEIILCSSHIFCTIEYGRASFTMATCRA